MSDDNITVGDVFAVDVWVDGEENIDILTGFGFDVSTTGAFFTYTGYTIGSDFVDFSDPSNMDNVAGLGDVAADDVFLASLSFNADAAGTGSLSVLGLYDGAFYGLFYVFNPDDIDATKEITVASATVPEPATILLVTTGILGMGVFGRKKWRNGK